MQYKQQTYPVFKRIGLKSLLLPLFLACYLITGAQPESVANSFKFQEVTVTQNHLYIGTRIGKPRNLPTPQACQLENGTWVLAFNDQQLNLQLVKVDTRGNTRNIGKVPNSGIYGMAASGNNFALLRAPLTPESWTCEVGELFLEVYNIAGKRTQQLQLTGTETIVKERTQFNPRYNASLSRSGDTFDVFYNFRRDNEPWSDEYNNWIRLSADLKILEQREKYDRDIRNVAGTVGEIGYVAHVPTRTPRALVLSMRIPKEYGFSHDDHHLFEIRDGQDKKSLMCHDSDMEFAAGDAVSVGNLLYISFVDGLNRKDYDAGILEINPKTGKHRIHWLPGLKGSQASVPRIGRVGEQLVVLQKELPASVSKSAETPWRKGGETHFDLDAVRIRTLTRRPGTTPEISKAEKIEFNWLDQPLHETSKCRYFGDRDRTNGRMGVRSFQGQDAFLVFDGQGANLKAVIISSRAGT